MTYATLFVPLAIAAALTALTTAVHRRLPPPVAARAISATTVAVATAGIPALWLLAMSYIAHLPVIGASVRWCAQAVGLHGDVPWFVGVPAMLLVIVGTPRAVRAWMLDRRLRIHTPGRIEYIDAAEPYAVTIPGKGGRIIISTALVGLVDDAELHAVIAHEQAHARFRHDRYLLGSRVVAAALPMMRPLTARLQFVLERWADESAARRCNDRHTVAAALAKVALAQTSGSPIGPMMSSLNGFGDLGVTARVKALIGAAPSRPGRTITLVLWLCIAATGLLGAVQVHHFGRAIAALCRST